MCSNQTARIPKKKEEAEIKKTRLLDLNQSCSFNFLNLNYRFGYFVFKQPEALDYADEGGPTDACSPNMSNGRGPFK